MQTSVPPKVCYTCGIILLHHPPSRTHFKGYVSFSMCTNHKNVQFAYRRQTEQKLDLFKLLSIENRCKLPLSVVDSSVQINLSHGMILSTRLRSAWDPQMIRFNHEQDLRR